MGAYLICEDGPTVGSIASFLDGEEWILGRDPSECFFVIEDPMVSRRHAILKLIDETYFIENLSEVNPVLINDEPVETSAEIHEGDTLQIGNNYFRFTLQDPREANPSETGIEENLPQESEPEASSPLSKLPFISPSENRFLIKVISGPNQGAEFGMNPGETHIIGKDPATSDIIFQDLSVSRQHARITLSDSGEITIEDLDSRNGILVNGAKVDGASPLTTQDLVSMGTTSFLIIDREGVQDTIFSPPSPSVLERDLENAGHPMDGETPLEETASKTQEREAKNWKETFIPTRHLFVASVFSFIVFVGIVSLLALFKSHTVVVDSRDEGKEIKHIVSEFGNVQYSYNPQMGKVFLIGHVLTDVDHAELMYLVRALPFIKSIEDNVVVDEGVWEDMNALLSKNVNWRGVMVSSTSAGKFVVRGYLETEEESARLQEYLNLNFPYLNLLENQVVVERALETQVQNFLIEQGFVNVTFQFANGDLIMAGRVNSHEETDFNHLVERHISKVRGIRQVKNFVIFVSESTARIDLSNKYRVTGTSKFGNSNKYVLINGKILATGDMLDGMMITGITENDVQLDQDGIKYKITYTNM